MIRIDARVRDYLVAASSRRPVRHRVMPASLAKPLFWPPNRAPLKSPLASSLATRDRRRSLLSVLLRSALAATSSIFLGATAENSERTRPHNATVLDGT